MLQYLCHTPIYTLAHGRATDAGSSDARIVLRVGTLLKEEGDSVTPQFYIAVT